MKMMKGLEHLTNEERLRAGADQLGREKAQKGYHQYAQIADKVCKEDRATLFSAVTSDRPEAMGTNWNRRGSI